MNLDEMKPRDLVVIAAKRTDNEAVRNWLVRDEEGSWEKLAAEYMDKLRDFAKTREHQVNEAIVELADALRLIALESMIRYERKRAEQ